VEQHKELPEIREPSENEQDQEENKEEQNHHDDEQKRLVQEALNTCNQRSLEMHKRVKELLDKEKEFLDNLPSEIIKSLKPAEDQNIRMSEDFLSRVISEARHKWIGDSENPGA